MPEKPRVLIVDDDIEITELLEDTLVSSGCCPITTYNGKDALEKAENEIPDLILLDTNMPIMNGHETLEHMSKDPQLKNIPVIMVTAACEMDDIATASSFGVVDYIAKPFDFTELKEKIANALAGKKALSGV